MEGWHGSTRQEVGGKYNHTCTPIDLGIDP